MYGRDNEVRDRVDASHKVFIGFRFGGRGDHEDFVLDDIGQVRVDSLLEDQLQGISQRDTFKVDVANGDIVQRVQAFQFQFGFIFPDRHTEISPR